MDALYQHARQIWAYATLKRVTWLVEDRLAACRYPRSEKALLALAEQGVEVLVNLHEQPHSAAVLARHGLTELHLPVRDFTAPTLGQLENGIAAIELAISNGRKVAVHCGAGLGRTRTLLACYLVNQGLGPDEALVRVRAMRPWFSRDSSARVGDSSVCPSADRRRISGVHARRAARALQSRRSSSQICGLWA